MVRKISILELEGLALNGFVDEVELIDCYVDKNVRYSKLRVKLFNNEVVETPCDHYARISRVYLVLVKYKDLGKTIVRRELSEEMMSGITYDLDPGRNDYDARR